MPPKAARGGKHYNASTTAQPQTPALPTTQNQKVRKKMRNRKNYNTLPYNPNLKTRAKELRKAGNLPEVLLWQQLKNKSFKNYDFDRQKIIGNYIVDFFCTNRGVVIEIDGSSHENKTEYDKERDTFLESQGLTVIRIQAKDILNNLQNTINMLTTHPALTPPKV